MTEAIPEHLLAKLTEIRRQLHTIPDLSGQEQATALQIGKLLTQFTPDRIIEGIGGAGIAAIYESPNPGTSVMIRCELDGLPITETGNRAYRSIYAGRGHQCGHDGHMSIVLGVASIMQQNPPPQGRVILLFQPAEETGTGARAVLADPRFEVLEADYVLALHNLPGFEHHHVLLKDGHTNCASRGIRIRFSGKTAHASMPETGISPAVAMASIIRQLDLLSTGGTLNETYCLVTIVHAALGERAFGVSPGEAEVWATLRTVADEQMQSLVEKATIIATQAAEEQNLVCSVEFEDIFYACSNDSGLIEQYRMSAEDLGLPITELDDPLRFSEDFGEYGKTAQSAMFFLGAGIDHPALHNPDYDFPDELIASGTAMLYQRLYMLTVLA